MKILANIAIVFIAGYSILPCMAQNGDITCQNTITRDLCEQLKNRDNDALLSFVVMFKRDSVDSPISDPNKDTAAPTGGPGTPSDFARYTQELFGKYDLRLPEDTVNRANAPTQIEGLYRLFATKSTILALSTENFVQEVHRWAPDLPAGNRRLPKTGLKLRSSQYHFNVRGQQLKESTLDKPQFKVRIDRP
jgi:hypothetical protein